MIKHLASLVIRKMQTKIIRKYTMHSLECQKLKRLTIPSDDEDTEQMEHSRAFVGK